MYLHFLIMFNPSAAGLPNLFPFTTHTFHEHRAFHLTGGRLVTSCSGSPDLQHLACYWWIWEYVQHLPPVTTFLSPSYPTGAYMYLFTRRVLGWRETNYGLWVTYKNLLAALGKYLTPLGGSHFFWNSCEVYLRIYDVSLLYILCYCNTHDVTAISLSGLRSFDKRIMQLIHPDCATSKHTKL